MTLKILCKLSTETKRYSSHTILQNFNLPTKHRPLLLTAILWRRPSNVLLSSTPLVRRPNVVTACRLVPDDQRSWPSCRWQLDGGGTAPIPPFQHDPQSWNLVDNRPPTNLRSSHCCRRRPCRTFPYEDSATGERPQIHFTTPGVNNPNTRHVDTQLRRTVYGQLNFSSIDAQTYVFLIFSLQLRIFAHKALHVTDLTVYNFRLTNQRWTGASELHCPT